MSTELLMSRHHSHRKGRQMPDNRPHRSPGTLADLRPPRLVIPVSVVEKEMAEKEEPALVPKTLIERTQIRSASITGRNHMGTGDVVLGGNNQDALLAVIRSDYGMVIVCDGCSQGKHSEVGSKIMVRAIARAFEQHRDLGEPEAILQAVQKSVVARLNFYTTTLSLEAEPREKVVRDYFLSTVVGFFFTEDRAFFFGLGDGVYGHDGKLTVVEPAEDNHPIYLGYHLFPKWPEDIPKSGLKVYEILDHLPDSIFIASDGVNDLMELKDKSFPGTGEEIGEINRLWEDPKYFENPDALTLELRRLQLIHKHPVITTREDRRPGRVVFTAEVSQESTGGYLPDDTTIAIVTIENPKPKQTEPQRQDPFSSITSVLGLLPGGRSKGKNR